MAHLKMPHSNFKERSYTLNTGVEKSSCGQSFDFVSEKDMNMKLQIHCKVCLPHKNLPSHLGYLRKL